jgi:hypothetical protein
MAPRPEQLTKTQIGLLDFLVEQDGRAFIFRGSRTLTFGNTKTTGEPAAQCNDVSIYFLQRFGWIEAVPSNMPGRYKITMQGRIVRCKHRWWMKSKRLRRDARFKRTSAPEHHAVR